jgi:AAA family ATP:ADP antiporter
MMRILDVIGRVDATERRATLLAFTCYFVLLAVTYILRPLRDTMATVFGAERLQFLYTLTLVTTMLFSGAYVWLTTRYRLSRVLPGVFWFLLINVVLLYLLFVRFPASLVLAAAYWGWFSAVNLLMISVFWSLMVDVFSPTQATRLFAFIAAGGSLGSIAGPLITKHGAATLGIGGLMFVAAVGMAVLVLVVHLLMREKARLRTLPGEAPHTTLDQPLGGNPFDGFVEVFQSAFMRRQVWFMLFMTFVSTVAYFIQTDLVAKSFSELAARTAAIADIDLWVNVLSALVLTFGIGRFMQRFGVTSSLLLNPLIMLVAYLAVILSPTLLMIQGLQVARRVTQYAIARPAREICFTVVPQDSRYRAKNVVDTVVYRGGDLLAAWMTSGLAAVGIGLAGTLTFGLLCSGVWGASALALGRRYEQLRGDNPAARNVH